MLLSMEAHGTLSRHAANVPYGTTKRARNQVLGLLGHVCLQRYLHLVLSYWSIDHHKDLVPSTIANGLPTWIVRGSLASRARLREVCGPVAQHRIVRT